MWGTTNNYGVINGGGDRPLGDYTEQQRQLSQVYDLAKILSSASEDTQLYASLDIDEGDYALGQSDQNITGMYGLEPYIVADKYKPTTLVKKVFRNNLPDTLNSGIPSTMLRTILRKIVEDA